ncbi:class I SAM-dependent methyltransferase [Actinophytocola sp.]|uniref:class I SAM-dependent methyltransferase n=1 Tax=Actinophytocola sp. TaxID=1872138 RepID=UPI00389ADFF7
MTDAVRSLAHHYSAAAAAYERLWAGLLHRIARQLLDRLPLAGARRVLDVGTGVGTLLPALAESAPAATVIGTDRAPGMIARAPATFPRVVSDAARLPFASGSVDVAVLAFMLFHLPDPLAGLRAAHRVLAAGGTVGTATWGRETPVPAVEIWEEELDRHNAPPDAKLIGNHDLLDTPDKMTAMLREAGFADVTAEPVSWEQRPTPAEFLEQRVSLGHSSRRLAGMPARARAEMVRAGRARLAALGPEGFVQRREIVLAVASKRWTN